MRPYAWYRKATDQGDAEAQFAVGEMYRRGWDGSPNPWEAGRWYRRAADQGHAKAQNNRGTLHLSGEGAVRNESEARQLFSLASSQGVPEARANLEAMDKRQREIEASSNALGALVALVAVAAVASALSSDAPQTNTPSAEDKNAEMDRQLERQRRSLIEQNLREQRSVQRMICSSRGGYFFEGTGTDIGFCSK